MKTTPLFCAAALALGCSASPVQALTLTMGHQQNTPLVFDTNFDGVGDNNFGGGDYGTGSFGGFANGMTVFRFQIDPSFPVSDPVTSASFQLSYTFAQGLPAYNIDLYGLRSSASPTVLNSDYAIGASVGALTLIANDIVTPTTSYNTFQTADATAFVAANFTPGNFLFFQAVADGTTASVQAQGEVRYLFDLSNDPNKTSLTITTVPEPATVGSAVLSTAALLVMYRRRRSASRRANG